MLVHKVCSYFYSCFCFLCSYFYLFLTSTPAPTSLPTRSFHTTRSVLFSWIRGLQSSPRWEGNEKLYLLFRQLCKIPVEEQKRGFSKVTDNQATELYFEEVFEQVPTCS